MKDWGLARRDLLKRLGVGAACLPLLRAGVARGAGAAKHLIIIAASEGYRMKDWQPNAGPLAGQTLPFSAAGLEAHKNDVIFLPDLSNPGFSGGGGGGGHGSYGSVYWGLDAGNKTSYKQPTGKTIDQQVATNLPKLASGRSCLSLHVQLDRAPKASSEAGSSRCFWLGKGQPINPIGDPYMVYGEIFGGSPAPAPGGGMTAPDPAIKRLMLQRKSILDYVGKNLKDLSSKLGNDDRMAIEAHHEAVRDLETQLQAAGAPPATGGGKCAPRPGMMIDLSDGLQYPNIMKAHMHLMVDAIKCGITNVATLQLSDSSGNNINFGFVPGIPPKSSNNYKSPYRNWHDLGHNPIQAGQDHKRIVDKWCMERLSDLIADMKAVQDPGGGTLFDQSVILWGNHMQDGSNHDETKIPWLLAGNCGGYFQTGQCAASPGKPLNGVMTDICQAMGVPSIYGAAWAGLRKGA